MSAPKPFPKTGFWLWLAISALTFAVGCRPELPAGYDAASAAAFQKRYDEQIGAEDSPLTTIDAYYLGPGEGLSLRFEGAKLVRTEAWEEPAARFVVDDNGFICRHGCSEHDGPISRPVSIRLGRKILRAAPQKIGQDAGGRVLVGDPDAPGRAAYRGLSWFPVDPALILPAKFEPTAETIPVSLATSRGLKKDFELAGHIRFEVAGTPVDLVGYRSVGASETAPILVPFTDATSGDETYPVGRYLQVHARDGVAAVDFNRATNPWCAYSPHYNCPVPDLSNTLPMPIRAGERTYDASR